MKKRSDGLYQKRVCIGEEKGQKKYAYVYGKTLVELAKKEREALVKDGPITNLMTFEEIANRMLKIEEQRISESEYKLKKFRIEQMSKNFKNKFLDSITIEDINSAMLEIFAVNPSTGKITGKRTLTRYLDAASAVFEFGIQCRITSYNPVKYVTPPKNAIVKKRTALTKEERDIILAHTDIRYVPAQIMMLTGLRRGELTALTWGDINFEAGYISVTKSYDYKSKSIKSTKTEAGMRNVPITKTLLPILKNFKKNYVPIAQYDDGWVLPKTGKKRKPKKAQDDDYVITGEVCGRMSEPAWGYLLETITAELGFSFDWHSLRHTYASILYEAGVDTLSAKELLGHSDVKTTIGIYTHLSERGKLISISKLDDFLLNS